MTKPANAAAPAGTVGAVVRLCTLRELNPTPGMPLRIVDSGFRWRVKEVHEHGCSIYIEEGQRVSPHLHFVDFSANYFVATNATGERTACPKGTNDNT